MPFFIVALIICVIILFVKQSNLKREIKHLQERIAHLNQNIAWNNQELQVPPPPVYGQAAPPLPPVHRQVTQSPPPVYQQVVQSPSPAYQQVASPPPPSVNRQMAQSPPPVHRQAAPPSPVYEHTTPPKKTASTWFRSEDWVGINLVNRLGALLIIIGAIAIAAFEGFPTILRTVVLFAFALAWIVVGEVRNRKKSSVAGIGVSATGVALLYVAIAAGYFVLGTLNVFLALLTCVIATALGVLLAVRHKAQVIGCFALIGGYLPIFALGGADEYTLFGVVIYFLFLSLTSLLLALRNKWQVMQIMGFVLTVIGTSYVGWIGNAVLGVVYACFAFLFYTALPLIATYRSKGKFNGLDLSLIIINTVVGAVILFLIANRLDVENIHAYLSLGFALIYACMALLVKRVFANKAMEMVFTLEAIAFFALFVPFFFDLEWFTYAWVGQGVVLASYGILRQRKITEYSGLALLLLALGALFQLESVTSRPDTVTFQYASFTLAGLLVLISYIRKKRQHINLGQVVKCLSLVNLLLFTLYALFEHAHGFRYVSSLAILATLILAFVYVKLPPVSDASLRQIAKGMQLAALFGLVGSSIYYLVADYRLGAGINFLVLGATFALMLYFNFSQEKTTRAVVYKNINLISMWVLLLILSFGVLVDFFLVSWVLVTITLVFALGIYNIKRIRDGATKVISLIMVITGLLILFVVNTQSYEYLLATMLVNVLVQALALFAIYRTIKMWRREAGMGAWEIITMSSYFLVMGTQTAMVQGEMSFTSAIFSIAYAIVAFIWIILGFRLRLKRVRQIGLWLSIAAVAKLLIVDTWGLEEGMRIISYISLGLILMLISFVYQRLSRKEKEMGEKASHR